VSGVSVRVIVVSFPRIAGHHARRVDVTIHPLD
jgi:hypothetical protein